MDVRRVAGWLTLAIMVPLEGLLVLMFGLAVFPQASRFDAWNLLFALAQFVLYAAVPAALILIGWRLARAPKSEPIVAPPRAHPTPVGALDEPAIDQVELLAQLDGPVSACPECGYLGVRAPGIRDGVWPGGGETGARFVCPRCQYQGIPVEFANGDDYAAWVRELHGEAAAS